MKTDVAPLYHPGGTEFGGYDGRRSAAYARAPYTESPMVPNAQVELAPHRPHERGRWLLTVARNSKGTNRVRGPTSNGGLGMYGLDHFPETIGATGFGKI